jgi:hypothetical protein
MADERPGSGFPGGNWVILAAAAISALYVTLQAPPLENLRPSAPASKIHTAGLQDVEARLWQDPLAAVVGHTRTADQERDASHTVAAFKRSLTETQPANPIKRSAARPMVLAVTIPGGGYAEDAEMRRRLRYAVVAALSTENYAPEDEKHIGYVDLEIKKNREDVVHTVGDTDLIMRAVGRTAGEGYEGVPDLVPFEWFKTSASPPIAMLWLNESALMASSHPLSALAWFFCELDLGDLAERRLPIVGPISSTTLEHMISEARDPDFTKWPKQTCKNGDPLGPLPSLQFYSPGATVAVSQLVRLGGTEAISKVWQYLRVTSGDDQLASILVEELGRRSLAIMPTFETNSNGQRSARHYDHVVLVSEADTVYGQYLPRAVQSAFEVQTGMIGSDLSDNTPLRSSSAITAVPNRRMTPPDIVPDWIHKYQYLQGLDGQMPASPRSDTPTSIQFRGSEGTDATALTGGAESRERAEGQSQFDYLRRLAARIEHLDTELRRKGEKVAAIGMFGSDVYDKLTILEALRPDFPEAIFFTTDLDALLLPQAKMRYTRNLVVASGFDLRLRDEVQADIPPFRDTYQTAGFLATRLAIENAAVAPDMLSPRLFEIGRTGAHLLSMK